MICAYKKYIQALTFCFVLAFQFACESVKREPLDISSLPDEVSLTEHIIPVFAEKCIKCHNGTTPPNLTVDNAYIDLTAGGYINLDTPEDSRLYEAINTGGNMQQYASDLDRALIFKWISQGAYEN